MAETSNRWELVRKFMALFTKEEVKTPLSFYFKAIAYFTASLVIILYAPLADDLKFRLVILVGSALLVVCLIVTVFGWCKPTHLVYGEAGHRAERRMEFGTEKKPITREQYDLLEGIEDKKQLPSGDK